MTKKKIRRKEKKNNRNPFDKNQNKIMKKKKMSIISSEIVCIFFCLFVKSKHLVYKLQYHDGEFFCFCFCKIYMK